MNLLTKGKKAKTSIIFRTILFLIYLIVFFVANFDSVVYIYVMLLSYIIIVTLFDIILKVKKINNIKLENKK